VFRDFSRSSRDVEARTMLRHWRSQFSEAVQAFHEDEEGMEAIQVVMLVAIAAVVLLVLKKYGRRILDYANNQMNSLMSDEEWEGAAEGAGG